LSAQAKAELGQAIAGQQKADQDEQRQSELFSKKIASQQDYTNAVQANLAAKAKVEAARAALDQAQLNLDFATITSPLNGIVGRTDLSVGDFVAAGSTGAPVTTVSTVDPIKLVFSVSEKDYLGAADRIAAILAKPLDQREATGELIRADGKIHPYKGRFLPDAVKREGVTVNRSSPDLLMVLGLYSPKGTYDAVFLGNYADINLVDAIKRVSGVGDVKNFTAQDYSMRVWLQPNKMAALGITPEDIANAIREQNAQTPAGAIGAEPAPLGQEKQYNVRALGLLTDPKQFEQIIVRSNSDGSQVKIKDVARVELGAQTYAVRARLNQTPASGAGRLSRSRSERLTGSRPNQAHPQRTPGAIPA
jgi:hypothetical protein